MEESQVNVFGIHLEVLGHISKVAADACRIARKVGMHVDFEFNGVKVPVTPDDDITSVVARYHELIEESKRHEDSRDVVERLSEMVISLEGDSLLRDSSVVRAAMTEIARLRAALPSGRQAAIADAKRRFLEEIAAVCRRHRYTVVPAEGWCDLKIQDINEGNWTFLCDGSFYDEIIERS